MKKRALIHIVWILVGVFALSYILKLTLDSNDNKSEKYAAPTSAIEDTTEKQKDDKEPIVHSAKDTVSFGGYQINVNDTKSEVGTEAGSKRVQIQLIVKNIGKEPVSIDSSYFEMFDQDQRKFEADSTDSSGKYANFMMDSINPGLSLTRYVTFVVPDDVTSVKLAMRDNMFDVLDSADYTYIDIGKIK